MNYTICIDSKDKFIVGAINKATKFKIIMSCNTEETMNRFREWHKEDIVFMGMNTKKVLVDMIDTILRWC